MISVITPSVRKDGLPLVKRCLKAQTFKDFEWIVASPFEYRDCDLWLQDPPKKEGDFWTLCKAWNNAYAHAKGDLIVNIQDMIWFPPDTLQRFWKHYMNNPKALVTAVGNHYDHLDQNGIPTSEVWKDPRIENGGHYRVNNVDMEMSVCSVPKQAILDCGGIDEEYDKGPGIQEKEMCLRLEVLGYEMWLDRDIEYRGIKHPRLTKDWDEKYWGVTAKLYEKHVKDLVNIVRPLNVGNIEKYLS